MSANTFVTLVIPSSPGVGAAADVSMLVFGFDLIVTAPPDSDGEIIIEGSQDGSNFAPVSSVFPLQNPAAIHINVIAHYLRVRRLSGTGSATAAVGSATTTLPNAFATIGYVEVDTSALGPLKTIICSGSYDGRGVVLEGTSDGSNYDVVAQFHSGDSDFVSLTGTWSGMRLRSGYDAPSGSLAIGAGYFAGMGSGTGGVGATGAPGPTGAQGATGPTGPSAGAAASAPFSTMANDEWYYWGMNPADANVSNLNFVSGNGGREVGSPFDNAINFAMTAIPMWFTEKGTITKLAMIQLQQNVPSPRQFGWIGIARNQFVNGWIYPTATIASFDCPQPAGLMTGGFLYVNGGAGGGVVSVANAAGEILWLIIQNPDFTLNAGGSSFWGADAKLWPAQGPRVTLDSIAVGSSGLPGSTLQTQGAIGWYTAMGLTYTVGQNFPAGQTLFSNTGPSSWFQGIGATAAAYIPGMLFQWERG